MISSQWVPRHHNRCLPQWLRKLPSKHQCKVMVTIRIWCRSSSLTSTIRIDFTSQTWCLRPCSNNQWLNLHHTSSQRCQIRSNSGCLRVLTKASIHRQTTSTSSSSRLWTTEHLTWWVLLIMQTTILGPTRVAWLRSTNSSTLTTLRCRHSQAYKSVLLSLSQPVLRLLLSLLPRLKPPNLWVLQRLRLPWKNLSQRK